MSIAIPLSADERLPLYQRVKDGLLAQIREGAIRPGSSVPSEDAMARSLGLAVGTVRRAVDDLVSDGLLERRHGRGTFVRRSNLGSTLLRFFRHVGPDEAPLRPQAEILSRTVVPATAADAKLFGGTLDGTLHMKRRRLVAGTPMLFEAITLPLPLFQAVADHPVGEFGDLLYPLYEDLVGRSVFRAQETLRFAAADAEIAEGLGVAEGTPVVSIDRIAFAIDNSVLESRRSWGKASDFQYSIEIR